MRSLVKLGIKDSRVEQLVVCHLSTTVSLITGAGICGGIRGIFKEKTLVQHTGYYFCI